MSKEDYTDFLKKFWISVASGLLILVVSAVVANSYVARATTDRSLRNEQETKQIREDLKQFSTKGDYHGIHSMFKADIDENKEDIEKFNDKVDEIKDLILKLHAK